MTDRLGEAYVSRLFRLLLPEINLILSPMSLMLRFAQAMHGLQVLALCTRKSCLEFARPLMDGSVGYVTHLTAPSSMCQPLLEQSLE